MSHIFTRIRHSYGDMKLESKFTLVLLLTATVPVIMMACFFYGKLYDMVVSYTIRQEQDTSAQTAPYIEDLVQQIIDAHDGITDQEFFQILFHQPVNSPFQMFLDTNDAQYFHTGTVSFRVHSSPPCSVLLSILVNARKKNTAILHILLPRPFIIKEKPVRLTSPFTVLQIISQIC